MSNWYDKELYDVVVHGIGYVKVTNYGGKSATMKDGEYCLQDRKQKECPNKTKSQILAVFHGLINKYQNLEINGWKCHYAKGKWNKRKVTFTHD
ncbi:hypothetical protein [Flagellimonas flava]|uniref:hypothetical protein n=1 Tax=Flagellimonas flava TaxID=570519 RepID=UPI003D650AFB